MQPEDPNSPAQPGAVTPPQPRSPVEPSGVVNIPAQTTGVSPAEAVVKPTKIAPPLQPAATVEAEAAKLDREPEKSEPVDESGERPPSAILGILKTVFSWVILPGLIVLFLHSFVFQAFYVSGSSMNPGFQDGDYLIIDKIGYTLSNVKAMVGLDTSLDLKRGDVLVFRYPNSPGTFFIKRLIGLPGDRVVVKNGKVTIYNDQYPNGLTLKETYIDPAYKTQGDVDEVVEKDKYFVMGDNRAPNGSFDSREWGQLPRYDVVGVATARLLPINELGPLKHPAY